MKHVSFALTVTASWLTRLFPLLLVAGSALADIGMSVIGAAFLLHSAYKRDWAWTKETWVRLFACLWLYMVVTAFFAQEPWEALRRSLPFARYFMFAAALAHWTLRDGETRRFFTLALAVTVFLVAADGLLQWCAGKDILRYPYLEYDGHIRLTGPFRAQILGIMIAWLSFPVCIPLLTDGEGRLRHWTYAIPIVFIIAVIVLSGERMALMLTLLGWLAALFLLPVKKRYVMGIFAAALAVFACLAYASPLLFERQVHSTLDTLAHWKESPYGKLLDSDLHIAAVNPVFGIGANHFRIVCKEMYSEPGACNLHPHNLYLEWFIEQGALGFCLFMAAIAAIFAKCGKNWQSVRHNPACIGFLIAFFLRLWPFASSTGFFSRWGAPPFWLVAGVLLYYVTRKDDVKAL